MSKNTRHCAGSGVRVVDAGVLRALGLAPTVLRGIVGV